MIETIRIDKEYPTYAAMLMPENRWAEECQYDLLWSFGASKYYATLYDPKYRLDQTWDFTSDSTNASKRFMETGIDLLESSYEIQVDAESLNNAFNSAVNSFFENADEYFIGPNGAEELLRTMIRSAVDLRNLAELTPSAEAIK